jgi:7-cyano-7-deazaguanine synthase
MNIKKAIVLLSGGLDSATILYYAKAKGFSPYCLIFEYGQRHKKEIQRARQIARKAKSPYQLMKIALPWQGSSLLDKKLKLPQQGKITRNIIPSTYVPARNIIFLSFAVSYAEAIGAKAVFIGANAIDYSGYPDCRPSFFKAYQNVVEKGLKSGVEKKSIRICAPLVRKTKAQIIRMGLKLKVPYRLTWSCYQGGRKPCGTCDSCRLREKGFKGLRIQDPIL